MRRSTALTLLAAFTGSAYAQDQCPQAGFVSAPATTERAAACCPPVPSATQGLSCDDSLTTNATGRLGRACVVEIGEIVQFTLPPSDAFNIAATVRSAAGEDSGRLLGGRGVVVSGRLAVPASTSSKRTCVGFSDVLEPAIEMGAAGVGGASALFACVDDSFASAGYLVAGGGGGAGDAGPDGDLPATNGADAVAEETACVAQLNVQGGRPSGRSGGYGGGCYPLPTSSGVEGDGGPAGFSGAINVGSGLTSGPLAITAVAERMEGSVSFFMECAEPSGTITVTVALSTEVETVTNYIATSDFIPPAPTVYTSSTTPFVEVATSTEIPSPSLIVEVWDATATPTVYTPSVVTPAPVVINEFKTELITPEQSTVRTTFTPPVSYFTHTVNKTSTPPVVVVRQTVTPARVTSTQAVDVTSTPATSTRTSVVSVATGSSSCSEVRMVYPPECCPAADLGLTRRVRRGVVFARALTTTTVLEGVTTAQTNVDATLVKTLLAPEAITSPTYVQGANTVTSVVIITAPTPLTTSTSLRYIASEPVTDVSFTTLSASSLTSTITVRSTLPVPLFNVTVAASAPSQTATVTAYFIALTPTSTSVYTAAAPLPTVQTTTVSHVAPTPVVTVTSTSFTRTPCATQLPAEPQVCPKNPNKLTGKAKALEVAIQRGKLAFGGKNTIIIDCGTAGTFYY